MKRREFLSLAALAPVFRPAPLLAQARSLHLKIAGLKTFVVNVGVNSHSIGCIIPTRTMTAVYAEDQTMRLFDPEYYSGGMVNVVTKSARGARVGQLATKLFSD